MGENIIKRIKLLITILVVALFVWFLVLSPLIAFKGYEKQMEEAAEKYYKLAIENKDFELKPHAMFNLARLFDTQGKTEDAISEYKNLINAYSDSNWADLANSRLILIDNTVVSE